jgi:hypothetical protein
VLSSPDERLDLAWPSVGRRRVETAKRSQIALGHSHRLAAQPFALTPPSGARDGGFSARCWPHMSRLSLGSSLLWYLQDDAKVRCCLDEEEAKGPWDFTERDSCCRRGARAIANRMWQKSSGVDQMSTRYNGEARAAALGEARRYSRRLFAPGPPHAVTPAARNQVPWRAPFLRPPARLTNAQYAPALSRARAQRGDARAAPDALLGCAGSTLDRLRQLGGGGVMAGTT